MNDLEIPDRARWALINGIVVTAMGESLNDRAVTAAARIIVATELRRMAADPLSLFSSSGDTEILTDRADELDPEGAS